MARNTEKQDSAESLCDDRKVASLSCPCSTSGGNDDENHGPSRAGSNRFVQHFLAYHVHGKLLKGLNERK